MAKTRADLMSELRHLEARMRQARSNPFELKWGASAARKPAPRKPIKWSPEVLRIEGRAAPREARAYEEDRAWLGEAFPRRGMLSHEDFEDAIAEAYEQESAKHRSRAYRLTAHKDRLLAETEYADSMRLAERAEAHREMAQNLRGAASRWRDGK